MRERRHTPVWPLTLPPGDTTVYPKELPDARQPHYETREGQPERRPRPLERDPVTAKVIGCVAQMWKDGLNRLRLGPA